MAAFVGEEISWGQRILGVLMPEFLEEINTLSELNVHNIARLYEVIGGPHSWLTLIMLLTGLVINTAWEVRELIFGIALAVFALHGARWPDELFLGGAPTAVVFGRATTLEDAEIQTGGHRPSELAALVDECLSPLAATD